MNFPALDSVFVIESVVGGERGVCALVGKCVRVANVWEARAVGCEEDKLKDKRRVFLNDTPFIYSGLNSFCTISMFALLRKVMAFSSVR